LTIDDFIRWFGAEALPLYQANERGFDDLRAHGRLHVARCLLYAERLVDLYEHAGLEVDRLVTRVAVSLHDVARKGHGVDIWEDESADRAAASFVALAGPEASAPQAELVRTCVLKPEQPGALEQVVVQSADCLDIWRCFPSEPGSYFRDELLWFLQEGVDPAAECFRAEERAELRVALIHEAAILVELTDPHRFDSLGDNLANDALWPALLDLVAQNRDRMPLLSGCAGRA
jgi:hypothetical protein